jgi:hypothetical protein
MGRQRRRLAPVHAWRDPHRLLDSATETKGKALISPQLCSAATLQINADREAAVHGLGGATRTMPRMPNLVLPPQRNPSLPDA